MPKYTVYFEAFSTVWVDVEAESEAEAREKAEQEVSTPSLCHQCSGEVGDINLGEIVDVQEKE